MPPDIDPFAGIDLAGLRRRTSAKWRDFPDDVVSLWVAEMDVNLAAPIRAALDRALDDSDTGYPSGRALAEAVAGFAADRWGWHGVDVERCIAVADVMTGVAEAVRLVTSPGDAVVVNCPVYPPFYGFIELVERTVVEAPLDARFRIDLATLERAFREAAQIGDRAAYLLCNPHNPTGVVHTRAELEAAVDLANSYGVRIVADEIHAPLVLPGATFTPLLDVPGAEHAVSVMSASKGWNLAGLKAALLIPGTAAAADLARMPEVVSHGPSMFGVLAHSTAYDEARDWLEGLLVALDSRRGLLGRLLAEHLPDVGFQPPQATFLAWLDCSRLDLGEVVEDPRSRGYAGARTGPMQTFLDEGRVALSSGSAFGTGGEGHVRLNYATTPEILTDAVIRMASCVRTR